MNDSSATGPIQKCLNGDNIDSLSDIELIAILLGSGNGTTSVYQLAFSVYQEYNGISGLARSGIRELQSVKGIGLTKAVRLLASIELGKRAIKATGNGRICNSPYKAWKELIHLIAARETEAFMVLVLDSKNRVIKKTIVSSGTINQSLVHPREVFRDAIREGAAGIIAAHNHPSGDTEPSHDDIIVTKRLKETGDIVGITLIDHIIITDNSYRSLKEEGYL